MAARRTSAQVTRQSAEDIASLTAQARISPTVLATLMGVPASTITHLFVKGVRMTARETREATALLKRVIALRQSGITTTNTAQLRKALEDEPQDAVCEIRSAYFTPSKENRLVGTVLVTLLNGKVLEFSNISRSQFFNWSNHEFSYLEAPDGIALFIEEQS